MKNETRKISERQNGALVTLTTYEHEFSESMDEFIAKYGQETAFRLLSASEYRMVDAFASKACKAGLADQADGKSVDWDAIQASIDNYDFEPQRAAKGEGKQKSQKSIENMASDADKALAVAVKAFEIKTGTIATPEKIAAIKDILGL